MFILSNEKHRNDNFAPTTTLSEDKAQALENAVDCQRYFHVDDQSWVAILALVEGMAPTIIDLFSDETQYEINRFVAWLENATDSSRHIPGKECIGFYACLKFLQPLAYEHSKHLACDMGFLMQMIEGSKDGIHFVIDPSEIGDVETVTGMTQMQYYAPGIDDTAA